MADMTKGQEARLNQAAIQFLGGHGRNFMRSMDPRNKEPLEQVQPWGEGRAAALSAGKVPVIQPGATKTVPAAAAPASGQATSANAPSVGAQVASNLLAGNSQQTAPANYVEMRPGQVPAAKPAASTISPGGFTVTPDSSVYGGHVRSFGTLGQDGSGSGYTSGPARVQQSPESLLDNIARQNLQGRGQVGGYSFDGSGADFAKFAQQPTRPAMQGGNTAASERPIYQQVRDRYEAGGGMEKPKYLGPESGLGWKTRLAKYNAELDAFEKLTGQRSAMDIAAMREAGAGRQSALQAQGVNDANDIARQRLAGDQQGSALDQQAKQLEIQSLQQRREIENRLNATTDPNERRALQAQLLALQGKDSAQKYQIVTREEIDPVTQMPIKTPIAVNQDDPSQSFVVRGQGGQQQFAQMPNDKKLMVKDQDYDTPRGPATWDGSKFIPLKQPPQM